MKQTNYYKKEFTQQKKGSYLILILSNLFTLVTNLYFPILLSNLLKTGMNGQSVSKKQTLLIFLFMTFMIGNHYFYLWISNTLTDTYTHFLKKKQYNSLITAKYSSFEKIKIDTHLQLIQNEITVISNYVIKEKPQFIFQLLICIFILLIVSTIHLSLFFIILVATILYLFGCKNFTKTLFDKNLNLVENQNSYFGKLLRIFEEAKTIKLYVMYEKYKNDLEIKIEKVYKATMSVVLIQLKLHILLEFIKYGLIAVSIYILVIHGELDTKESVPLFLLVQQYVNSFIQSIGNLVKFQEKKEKVSSIEVKLCEVELEKESSNLNLNTTKSIPSKEITSIGIKNLSFHYEAVPIFIAFNLDFTHGCYVIKGRNGSGKSTLFSLLLGLYEPTRGEIEFNNKSLKELDMIELRRTSISYIPQNPYLLESNLDDNLFSERKDNELFNRYLSSFGIEDLENKSIKENWNTSLSGGQLQKIALIKGLIKCHMNNVSLLIMDEPTNTLDKESIEVLIQEIKTLKKNTIIIVISHDNCFDTVADDTIVLNHIKEDSPCFVS